MDFKTDYTERVTRQLIVVGAGIIGLAVAYKARCDYGTMEVHVVEKSKDGPPIPSLVNSGVIHSGIYYQPQSLRARLSRAGNSSLKVLMDELNVPFKRTGKLILGNMAERQKVEQLAKRAKENRIDFSFVANRELQDLQPGLSNDGIGLLVRSTGITDPQKLYNAMRQRLLELGVVFHSQTISSLRKQDIGFDLEIQLSSDAKVVNAAGFGSLRLAQRSGLMRHLGLLPIMGRYLKYEGKDIGLRLPIYGLPHNKNVSLGYHLTPTLSGGMKIGPSSELALWGRLPESNSLGALISLAMGSERDAIRKFAPLSNRKLKAEMLASGSTLLKPISDSRQEEYSWGPISFRPQIVNKKTNTLVDDFIITRNDEAVHVLNVISPGWTSSLEIANEVLREAFGDRNY